MKVVDALRAGEIVLLETDTIVGLHGLASHPHVVKKLMELKGSREARGFLLLFFAIEAVLEAARPATIHAEEQLRAIWPGPLTAVLTARPGAPHHWSTAQGTLAARVPATAELRSLLEVVGEPLFSTSANRSGEAPARTLAEAREQFPTLTFWEMESPSVGVASTVVDFTVDPPRVLREGAVGWPPAGPRSRALP